MSFSEDRCREFASVGAGHAATALAKLFGRTVLMEPPRCWKVPVAELPDNIDDPEDWAAIIFTQMTGVLSGQAALLLSRAVVDEILLRLVGADPLAEIDARGLSALSETGNVALSAVAGALGEMQGGIVMPTVPRLRLDVTRALVLEELRPGMRRLPAYLAETVLAERDGPLRLRLLWIPED